MTSRMGTTSAGRSEAATASASRRESLKNRGSTSARFSGVSTLASSFTVERQSSPARSAASTSGNAWMSSAAVFRFWAAPFESLSSRWR